MGDFGCRWYPFGVTCADFSDSLLNNFGYVRLI
jgi:hypothetical protein